MNRRQKPLFSACLIALAALLSAAPIQGAFAAKAPSLGAASDFAVLSAAPDGGGAVTCTRSTIDGDVGSSGLPASVVHNDLCTITGAIIAPVSAKVLKDFNSAYDALAAVSCDQTLTGTLAGITLTPGVYCFDAAAALTGTLTLDGSGTWLFKIGTSGTGALTGTDFTVDLIGGASACNVTWWVAEAATMTRADFNGSILAGAAITVTGIAEPLPSPFPFEGRALATAAVTLTDVEFIGCEGGSLGGKPKCNQGVGNGPETCDPGNSNQGDDSRSNDELINGVPGSNGVPGDPGRQP